MRISDWSSDVCSSDLVRILAQRLLPPAPARIAEDVDVGRPERQPVIAVVIPLALRLVVFGAALGRDHLALGVEQRAIEGRGHADRSEEHTSELQSLMRISYAVFCLKKTKE